MWGVLASWGGSSVGSESHGLKTLPSHPFAVSNVLCARVFGVPDLPCGVGVMGWQLSWERQPRSLHQQSTRSQITGTPPQNTTAAQIRDYDAGCLSTFLRRHSRAHNFQRASTTRSLKPHTVWTHELLPPESLLLLFLQIFLTAS